MEDSVPTRILQWGEGAYTGVSMDTKVQKQWTVDIRRRTTRQPSEFTLFTSAYKQPENRLAQWI